MDPGPTGGDRPDLGDTGGERAGRGSGGGDRRSRRSRGRRTAARGSTGGSTGDAGGRDGAPGDASGWSDAPQVTGDRDGLPPNFRDLSERDRPTSPELPEHPQDPDPDPDPTRHATRKRRRTPPSDWQFPVLTDMGLSPERQRLVVVIASVIGVIAAACGLAVILTSVDGDYVSERPQSDSAAIAARLPATYQGWPSLKLFEPVGDRAKDGRPLTEKEIFSQKTLNGEKKLQLKLVAKRLDSDCSASLWGEELLQMAGDAECTQAARGLYASADGRYVGQYTLLNLRDSQAAGQLVAALENGYRGGWTRPLEDERAVFPAGGHTEAAGYALGHYVGLVWFGKADGAEPTARDDFVSLALTLRGAEKAIYRRVVTITGPAS
jgi:hypothetical protein